MNYRKIKVLIVLMIALAGLHAQVVIPTAGGNAAGSGGFVSYSVGEVVYIANIGANGSVLHGIQQPIEISTLTEVALSQGVSAVCFVYPNPVASVVRLKINTSSGVNIRSMSYQLLDFNGKLLESQSINADITNIDMSNRLSATYLLKIIKEGNEIRAFKIVKK